MTKPGIKYNTHLVSIVRVLGELFNQIFKMIYRKTQLNYDLRLSVRDGKCVINLL